ncbi:hypothetical protein Scep_012444 [Stephania cephalantha]|uniref:WDR11 first beta-propeller domain-containing protein n=1 Tax=Stephania cephalantha TaxID=152367 RepID=A0AAP0JGJ2_9MAGN
MIRDIISPSQLQDPDASGIQGGIVDDDPAEGCGKFVDVVVDPDNEVLYCAHLDGKHSVSNMRSKRVVW